MKYVSQGSEVKVIYLLTKQSASADTKKQTIKKKKLETFPHRVDFNIQIPLPVTAVADPKNAISLLTCALFTIAILSLYMMLLHLEWKGI